MIATIIAPLSSSNLSNDPHTMADWFKSSCVGKLQLIANDLVYQQNQQRPKIVIIIIIIKESITFFYSPFACVHDHGLDRLRGLA